MRGAVHFSRLHLQFWTNRGGVDLCLNGSHGVMYGLMSFAYINIIVICIGVKQSNIDKYM